MAEWLIIDRQDKSVLLPCLLHIALLTRLPEARFSNRTIMPCKMSCSPEVFLYFQKRYKEDIL